MREEKLTILRMLRDGRVSREDAIKLLQAIGVPLLDQSQAKAILGQVERGVLSPDDAADQLEGNNKVEGTAESPRRLCIRVEKDGKQAVNVRVPLGLIDVGMRLLGKNPVMVNGRPVDARVIWEAVKSGTMGTILDIDGDDGQHVEIAVE
ncbi:hypothetical protein [Sulfobacillus harzensis]|uniref:DUF2089 domain-containing protein n=1 Tax=Sulfobacillus harzensis TaxID=2729629 RepID=A0A7Y0L7Z9_9FIRM|nr:hypothetical protein [Sulfobacillus harzensis]NMP24998.1 hypothetical protein [Sulfobacillus harzensis]